MPLLDITKPAVIKFLNENYEKENRLRMNWLHHHEEKVKDAAILKRPPTHYYERDVIAKNMCGGMMATTRDHKVAGYNRRKKPIRDGVFIPDTKYLKKGHSIIDVGLAKPDEDPKLHRPDSSLEIDPVMRPIDPELYSVIYKSIPEHGRVQYLHKRFKMLPENRFYFSECVNWDYGWRVKDSLLRQKPLYPRCWALTGTLKSRVGPQPDPYYYKSSDPPGPSKCEQ